MNYLIVVSFVSLFILGFCDNLRGPLFPEIIKHFQVSDTLGSAYFALTSFVAFFASYFIRKHKQTHSLLQFLNLGILCLGIAFLTEAFSPSYEILMIGVVFFGISFGFLQVSQNNLVVYGTTEKNRSRMLSGLHSMYGISSLIAPLFVAGFSDWGWQKILLASSVVPIIFFAIVFFLNLRFKNGSSDLASSKPEFHPHLSWKEKQISFVISFYVIAEIMLGTRIALYMRRYFDYSLQDSSFYVTLLFVFMLIGRLIVSFYPPKISLKVQLLGSLVSSIFCLLMGMYFHPLFLVICGLTMAPFYPLAISYISEIQPVKSTELVSTTVAIQSLFIVSMHVGVGKIADLTDLKTAFWVGPICMILALVLLLGIRKENEGR